MTLVVYLGDRDETQEWVDLLSTLLPEMSVRDMDDPGDLAEVRYAAVWAPPPGRLRVFPNLEAIISIGAGIDHVLRDPERPAHVPILRTTGPDMAQRLREYVALHVLAHHRDLATTDAQQRTATWRQIVTPVARERRVGIMGLGRIGLTCALTLRDLGFDVAGWSRTSKSAEGIACFDQEEGLAPFLGRTHILVCMLPLTPETQSILNAGLFASLPRGASLINVGRGGHLVEQDLLDALADGQLSRATLDVFRTEPLPADHPFWKHPSIRITPHIASMIDARTGAGVIAANLRAFRATGQSTELADAARGY